MKLRNLIFALFLAIGAIGFVSCTGDDGEAGPAGPTGPAGPKGEPGDPSDAGSTEYNYAFLKTWGEEDGRIACEDPLLTEEGMFPGEGLMMLPAATDAVRKAPAAGDADTANGYVHVACAASVFDAVGNPNIDGVTGGDLTGDGVVTDNADSGDQNAALIFVKTHRGGDKNPVPQEGGKEPVVGVAGESKTVQATFTHGMFFANMDGTRAVGEVADRGALYRVCDTGDGTAPPALKGHWRAVNKVEKHMNTKLDDNGLSETIGNSVVTTTTKKICIRLDSLPGAVKCYVRTEVDVMATSAADQTGVAAGVTESNTEKIIIYGDGTNSMTVAPMAAAATHASNPGRLGPADAAADVQFIAAAASDFQAAKLCNLFSEAAPAQP